MAGNSLVESWVMVENSHLCHKDRQGHTCTDESKIVRSSESAPILILGGSPVKSFKLFNVLKKNGFPEPCPTQSAHLSCSREKDMNERESTGADGGTVKGTVTAMHCAEQGAHLSTIRSSCTHQRIDMVGGGSTS